MNKIAVRHPIQDFLIFILITFGIIGAGYLIGASIIVGLFGMDILMEVARLNLSNPNATTGLWILQIISTTIPILIASLVFAFYVVKAPAEYLKTGFKFHWLLPVLVLFIMLISSPLIECLSNINQKLDLPPILNNLEKWMRDTEAQARRVTEVFLQMKTIPQLLFNLLIVGLATSVVEEFMFRGCIQTILFKWLNNQHAAIWITAALFSAFHMEFFGFLPRMMLGVLFGYFVYYSGSIWTAVWAHFINNGTAVVASYFYQNKKLSVNPDDTHIFNWPIYLFSLIIVLFLLYLYRDIATGKKRSLQL
jgi:membrane protease YdiL (CAAX protease family)